MIKRILVYSNKEDKEILSQKSEPVTEINDEIKALIQDMKDTVHAIHDAKGLSAIQLGVPKRICFCSWAGEDIIMINPTITRTRGEEIYKEGCLSVPGVYKEIPRFQKVWCTYTDENGEQKEIAEGGRMSDIIQHEMDHFEGSCAIYSE